MPGSSERTGAPVPLALASRRPALSMVTAWPELAAEASAGRPPSSATMLVHPRPSRRCRRRRTGRHRRPSPGRSSWSCPRRWPPARRSARR
ncbi:hypothetical protein G6F50_017887 [Rhizopus delemar]|uniref:Uncharacterized protein n=1 Tax=Rhizopus delemar TaxID=936053 RepID=A0A9P6XPT8_9FUNG|nr:hypothetical protein G6F50_017887 [Rhizopus delemar]